MVWLRALGVPLPIAVMSSLENTQDKSKIELCTCTCQPVVSEPKRMSATLVALAVEGDCVLDVCLE